MARTSVFQAGETRSKLVWVTKKIKGMEDLRYNPDDSPEEEEAKTEKALRCARNIIDWSFMRTLNSIPGNPFYKEKAPEEDQDTQTD